MTTLTKGEQPETPPQTTPRTPYTQGVLKDKPVYMRPAYLVLLHVAQLVGAAMIIVGGLNVSDANPAWVSLIVPGALILAGFTLWAYFVLIEEAFFYGSSGPRPRRAIWYVELFECENALYNSFSLVSSKRLHYWTTEKRARRVAARVLNRYNKEQARAQASAVATGVKFRIPPEGV